MSNKYSLSASVAKSPVTRPSGYKELAYMFTGTQSEVTSEARELLRSLLHGVEEEVVTKCVIKTVLPNTISI